MEGRSGQPGYATRFDYRVDIHRRRNRITATLDGVQLAASERTLLVDEQDHGLVFYFPRQDVRLDLLVAMPERSSVCPWKGTASYWRSARGETWIAWSYETPHREVAQIAGYIAFDQSKVTVAIGVAP
jgi:uncharacterized protein (DUF427 family)